MDSLNMPCATFYFSRECNVPPRPHRLFFHIDVKLYTFDMWPDFWALPNFTSIHILDKKISLSWHNFNRCGLLGGSSLQNNSPWRQFTTTHKYFPIRCCLLSTHPPCHCHHPCHHRRHQQAVYDLLFEVCAIFMYSLPHLSPTYTVQITILIIIWQKLWIFCFSLVIIFMMMMS